VNVVDSSGWLEYFADGPGADFFAPAVEDVGKLLVPVITLYEVYKVVMRQRGENAAIDAIAAMQQGRVITIDTGLALTAARVSQLHSLPMADAFIYATSRANDATLWTEDADFKDLERVNFHEKSG